MCELQLIKRIDNENLNENDLKQFVELMNCGKVFNNNAYGFFTKNILFKNKGTFKQKTIREFKDKILKSNFIVGHNRFATSGDKNQNENNHPFELNDFVLIHNGIISNHFKLIKKYNVQTEIETDSYIILFLIDYFFNRSKQKERIEKIKDAIRKTALELCGTYSVLFYDRKTNNIFYFKNKDTLFYFSLAKNVLIGTTSEINLEDLYKEKKLIFEFRKEDFLTTEAKSETIYLINDKIKIKEIGKFKESEYNVIEHKKATEIQKDCNYNCYGYEHIQDTNTEINESDFALHDILLNNYGYTMPYQYNEKEKEIIIRNDKDVLKDTKNLGIDYRLSKKDKSIVIPLNELIF